VAAGAEVLKEFLVSLGYDVDEKGASAFNDALKSSTTKVLAFAAGVQALAAGVFYGIMRIAESQSAMLTTADAAGTTVARLEELRYVATQTGAAAEAMDSSIKGLNASMAGATIGQGGLATFQRLGIRIKDANGRLRDTVDVLFEVGEKIKGMDKPRQQMFLAQLGIDKSLVRALTEDVTGLREAYRQMYAAAGTDADQAAQASREFVNELGTMKTLFDMLARSVSMRFIGRMKGDLQNLRKSFIENFEKVSRIIQTIISVILRISSAAGALTMRLVKWMGGLVDWFGQLDDGTQNVILMILAAAAAWRFLNLSFLATPLGMVITGLVGIAMLLDDLHTYLEGGESLLDWGPWAGTIMQVVAAFQPLWEVVKAVFDVLLAVGGLLLSLFSGDSTAVLESYLNLWGKLLGLVQSVWGVVEQFAGGAWGAIKGALGLDAGVSAPALAPSPAGAAALAPSQSTANLKAETNIYVNGAGDPSAVGRAVGGEQARVNADLVRNARGAAR